MSQTHPVISPSQFWSSAFFRESENKARFVRLLETAQFFWTRVDQLSAVRISPLMPSNCKLGWATFSMEQCTKASMSSSLDLPSNGPQFTWEEKGISFWTECQHFCCKKKSPGQVVLMVLHQITNDQDRTIGLQFLHSGKTLLQAQLKSFESWNFFCFTFFVRPCFFWEGKLAINYLAQTREKLASLQFDIWYTGFSSSLQWTVLEKKENRKK